MWLENASGMAVLEPCTPTLLALGLQPASNLLCLTLTPQLLINTSGNIVHTGGTNNQILPSEVLG
jgi:hypothetical protein